MHKAQIEVPYIAVPKFKECMARVDHVDIRDRVEQSFTASAPEVSMSGHLCLPDAA